jgi:hypothetical protein
MTNCFVFEPKVEAKITKEMELWLVSEVKITKQMALWKVWNSKI